MKLLHQKIEDREYRKAIAIKQNLARQTSIELEEIKQRKEAQKQADRDKKVIERSQLSKSQ